MRNLTWLLVASALGAQEKAFVGARIIDGTGRPAIENGALVIKDGRIAAVGRTARAPAGAERSDVRGKTIMPGLINGHGHFGDPSQVGLYARYGVTTVIALGGEGPELFRLRDQQETAALDRARLMVAGPVITANSAEDARRRVDEVAALKADWVKIRVDDNLGAARKMAPEVYRAVIEQAHSKGMRVAVHIFYLEDAKAVLRAGADYIAHSVRDLAADQELVSLLRQRDICLCPTLMREVSTFVYESTPPFFADPFFLRHADRTMMAQLQEPQRQKAMAESPAAKRYKAALDLAKKNLKKLSDSGVRVIMGTDTGAPFGRFQGYFEHLELELMVQSGLTPMQALVSATGDAARCAKLTGKVGTLEPGAWADFLVLAKNPLDDIRNTRSLESVWIAGNRVP